MEKNCSILLQGVYLYTLYCMMVEDAIKSKELYTFIIIVIKNEIYAFSDESIQFIICSATDRELSDSNNFKIYTFIAARYL